LNFQKSFALNFGAFDGAVYDRIIRKKRISIKKNMAKINRTLRVKTGADGGFEAAQIFNPPGFWNYTIQASARLVSPAGTSVTGKIEITAANDSTGNQPRNFTISTGETEDLGSWELDGGDNTVRVTGKTSPARANEMLEIEVTAEV
jgi:hypothetical protein